MDLFRIVGSFAIIPTVLLITVSFFVIFTLTKIEKSALRIFGMVVVGLLWIASLIVFSAGLLIISDGLDYFEDHNLANTCKCRSSYKMAHPGYGMTGYSYHNKMMNPHEGMMTANPHEGMMDPHQDMMNKEMNCPGMKK